MASKLITDLPVREWFTDRFADVQFANRVPSVKWHYLTQLVRPLADEVAANLWSSLFAGVIRPFNPQLARGWMGQLFKRSPRGQGSDFKHGESLEKGLCDHLNWEPTELAYLVIAQNQIFMALWSDWLECIRRNLVPLDTAVMCSDSSSKVAVFWEGFGPYFADRGSRALIEIA